MAQKKESAHQRKKQERDASLGLVFRLSISNIIMMSTTTTTIGVGGLFRRRHCYGHVLFLLLVVAIGQQRRLLPQQPQRVSAFVVVVHPPIHQYQRPLLPYSWNDDDDDRDQRRTTTTTTTRRYSKTTRLWAGRGVAANYTWTEDQFEIEVSFTVPKRVRASHVHFKATSTSIDLRYHHRQRHTEINDNDNDRNDDDMIILLDKNRKLKGKINLDGTYWLIADDDDDHAADHRLITVTIEKHIPRNRDDFTPIEYDWKAVYLTPDPTITVVEYDKPEPLNVREYAASMGVDVDNIDMSKVDKTMFSSGLNVTKSTLDTMYQSGLLSKETITRQTDGTEYTVDDETGDPVPYSLLDHKKNNNKKILNKEEEDDDDDDMEDDDDDDEASGAEMATTTTTAAGNTTTVIRQVRNMTRAAFAMDSAALKATTMEKDNKKKNKKENQPAVEEKDPIEGLTVARLKQMLRSQGLPVSGNKAVLQDRLRRQVNALLQGRQDDPTV